MHREARLGRSFIVATAWHATALGALALTVPGRARTGILPHLLPSAEMAIEVVREGEARPAPASELPPRAPARDEARDSSSGFSHERASREASERVRTGPSAPAGEPVVSAEGSRGAREEGWTFHATTDAPLPGAPMPGASAPLAIPDTESPRTATTAMDSVRSALDAHDRRTGLSAGGAFVQTTREVVSAGRLPAKGHAQIEVRTDGAGVVTSVRILEASAASDAWNDLAEKLAAQLRAKPMRVPPGGRGLLVTLRVETSLRTPSGHEAGPVSLSVMHKPAGAASGGRTVNVSPLGASIDTDPTDMLLDATSSPRRVVTISIAKEERL